MFALLAIFLAINWELSSIILNKKYKQKKVYATRQPQDEKQFLFNYEVVRFFLVYLTQHIYSLSWLSLSSAHNFIFRVQNLRHVYIDENTNANWGKFTEENYSTSEKNGKVLLQTALNVATQLLRNIGNVLCCWKFQYIAINIIKLKFFFSYKNFFFIFPLHVKNLQNLTLVNSSQELWAIN